MESEEKKDCVYLPFDPKMEPCNSNTLNVKRTALISLAFFTVLMAWSYFNFKVPLLLDGLLVGVPIKDFVKGVIMAMDNLIAVVLQPFFGDLSDRTRSKLGRRTPYIIIGTCSAAVFFVLIPLIQVLAGMILIIFLFDFAMSIYRSASIAILPDYTSETVYSKGSAIQQFIANMGGIIGFAIPIIVGLIPNLTGVWFDALGFLIISILMVLLLVIQISFVKETPTGENLLKIGESKLEIDHSTFNVKDLLQSEEELESEKGFLKSYKKAVRVVRNHRDFAYFLLSVIFMYLAFASVESFFSSFAVFYIGISEAEAATLFIAYSAPMVIVAYFVGLVGQSPKIGRKTAVKIFLGWLIISVSFMAFFVVPAIYQNYIPILVLLTLVLISVPWMGFIVNSFSILWALAPEGKTGLYTGIYYTFNQAAYTLAPIIFGGVLSSLFALGDYRYIVMFPYILILIVLALLFFWRVKSGEIPVQIKE